MSKGLPEIAADLRSRFDNLHEAREGALANGRKIIQLAAKSIKHIQRRETPAGWRSGRTTSYPRQAPSWLRGAQS